MLYMKMFSRLHSFRKRNLYLTVYRLKINIDICCSNELHIICDFPTQNFVFHLLNATISHTKITER